MEEAEKQQSITDDFTEEDKISSDLKLWDYKVNNATLVGVITSIDPNGQFGRTIVVDTAEEKDVTVPSLTALGTKLAKAVVGNKVKIICLGLVKGKNRRDYYDFDVFIK